MPKWFNTAGPCKPSIHYMLPPLGRLPNLERLVAQQGYFVKWTQVVIPIRHEVEHNRG